MTAPTTARLRHAMGSLLGRWSPWALLCAVGVAISSVPAHAQDGEEQTARADPEDLPDRPVPDYDNRGEEPTAAGDVLLWVPRVLMSPFYLVSEFVIRRPLGLLVSDIEQGGDAEFLIDIFSLRKGQDFGFVPTAYFEFGFRTNVGLYFFLDNFPIDGNHFRIHAATGGFDYWKVSVVDHIPLGMDGPELRFRFHASDREDYIFAGFGPDTTGEQVGRYEADLLEGSAKLDLGGWASSRLIAEVGLRDWRFAEGRCCDDPTVHTLVDQGVLDGLPPAFEDGYTSYYQRLQVALDTRGHVGDGGVRVEAYGQQGLSLQDPVERRWLHWGGTAGLFLETPGVRRIVSLVAAAHFVDPLGDGEVPFPEQQLVGGGGLLKGFREGRLHGRSALVAAFQYQWPIWVWLDGFLQVAAGNAYDAHLEGLDYESVRGSAGIGFRTTGEPDHAFEVLFAVGTETIEQGLEIDTVRLVLGATEGF